MVRPELLMIGTPWQMLVVLLVVLILFGKRLPELMRSLGSSMSEFKKGIHQQDDEDDQSPRG